MKIGLIGCGGMGQSLAQATAGIDGTRIVAVCDRVAEAANKAAAKFDADPLIDAVPLLQRTDIDGVLVATPPFDHVDICIAAARAGKHVFVEKPLAPTVGACDAIIEAAAGKIRLMVGQVCRFFELHATVRQLVHGGVIGDPILISVHRLAAGWSHGGYNQPWRLSRELSGGALMEINAHEIDFMRHVCGEVSTVSAVGGTFVQHEADYPDVAVLTMRFDNGAIGTLHSSQVTALGACGGRIDGTLGSIHFPTLFGTLRDLEFKRWDDEKCPINLEAPPVERNPVQDEIKAWIQAIEEDREPPVTGDDGRKVVSIAEAAYASIASGQPVTPR